MEKIVTYKTIDGTVFDNEQDAIKHEEEIKRKEENKLRITTLSNGKQLTHDDIVEYFKSQEGCEKCVFRDECQKLYDFTRGYYTSTVCICGFISGGPIYRYCRSEVEK